MPLAEREHRPALQESLHSWVLTTLPQALAYATSILRDRSAAEDVVHDCYCRLLQKADVYDLPRDGLKILLRSISNACIDRKGRGRVLLSLDALDTDGCATNHLVDHRAEDPGQRAMAQELGQTLAEGLARLPLPQRTALHLKSMGFTLQEIADTLAVSVSNAGVLIYRARQSMEQHLAPFLEEKA